MTLREAAEYLNCNYYTLFRLVRSGEVPAFHVGKGWRCSRADLDRWIEGQHVAPAEPEPRPGRRPKKKR